MADNKETEVARRRFACCREIEVDPGLVYILAHNLETEACVAVHSTLVRVHCQVGDLPIDALFH
jgi:hypothetical protein